ncbi:MAG: UDP-4-amino-4-deoxy-L-arabinose aminotransferase [Victivallales bacterium]|jgi:UDP-4-amino-4-deoxy-L-arabinose-oxoglutarate aminotransferase|nr:UDP-4-amino-4-deoxy-L-arabinose aminotransferase [Victivallales bacterium]
MRNEFLPFTKPAITEADIKAVTEVLRSGWITNGPQNAALESGVCEITGNRFGVALSSATAAMHLLLKIKNIGPGDEVITPSMTWVSMVNMIALTGATPVFCDIDRDTMLATPEKIAEKITPRTKLIVPVHFAGAPLDLDGIRKVAGEIPVIEDAAHALGTYYKSRHVGSDGSAIYSFHAIKNITTGEGGMFVTNDEKEAELMRRWKFHGIGMDAFDRQNRGRSPQAEVIEPGFKYNLTDICAALGVSQLSRLVNINTRRRELAMLYRKELANISEIRPLTDPDYEFKHAWHLFVVRVDTPKIDRNGFMNELKLRNIGTGLHFRCAHLQKYYRETMNFRAGMLPNTEYNSDHICSLPLFPDMTFDDVIDVVEAIKAILAGK